VEDVKNRDFGSKQFDKIRMVTGVLYWKHTGQTWILSYNLITKQDPIYFNYTKCVKMMRFKRTMEETQRVSKTKEGLQCMFCRFSFLSFLQLHKCMGVFVSIDL
jgi:hypothetical protein